MEDNKRAAIEKIILLSKQDNEFNEELRKRLDITPVANSAVMDDERINQIYEYCIERISRNQAEDFYKDFPIPTLVPTLVEDYIRMESFRRKDLFGDFCLALYQQIECITNKICESSTLSEITDKMWAYEAYVKSTDGKELDIKERMGTYRIADLIFPFNNKNGISNAVEKSLKSLQNQYAIDKIRIIVYYFGYGAKMKSSDFEGYKEITGLLNDVYQCRNTNHRGNTLTEYETETLNRILPMKSFYYFKFLGVLAQYVDYIKIGSASIANIAAYAKTLPPKKVEVKGPKVLGKIDLKDDGKKRFK